MGHLRTETGPAASGLPLMAQWTKKALTALAAAWAFTLALPAHAGEPARHLAPGFSTRAPGSTLVVVPPDLELFSISAGGVSEPRADWTEAAQRHFRAAVSERRASFGVPPRELSARDLDELSDLNALHGAVAEAIFLHHIVGGNWQLPTKKQALDWSLGDAVEPLRRKSGADYALFLWIRDSYASSERKAAMVAMALFGVGLGGGSQVGYASLVDLRDGRVVWFNDLRRARGDLREAHTAAETLDALLTGFPIAP